MHTVKRLYSVLPFFRKRHAALTYQVVSRTAGILRSDLEPGRKNQAVELILFAIGDNAFLGNLVYPFALSIDEFDTRSVKSWQIAVVKAGTFTKLTVIWF